MIGGGTGVEMNGQAQSREGCGRSHCTVHTVGTPAHCRWDQCVGDTPNHQTAPLSLEQPEPVGSRVNNWSDGGMFITVRPECRARQGLA